jgi:cellulose synthase (UDP-forming)
VQWIDAFYSPYPSLVISGVLLAAVCFSTWRGVGRKISLSICVILATRYIMWRALYTLNLDDGIRASISVALLLAETYGYFQVLFFAYQAWDPLDRKSVPITTYPSVDIMVTIVNEPLYILKRTLIGCLAQNYPKELLNIYVLDDGPSEEVNALADELGVTYLSRPDRLHAKAGNVNHAMKHSTGKIIAFFDVDHVPVPEFLEKTVGFFADQDVAIVQTAQGFYNQDIFQKSTTPGRNVHNEQNLFFRTLQSGRDRHNSVFFAGSSGLLRRSALDSIGGIQTKTVTEDIHTSLVLHAKGYKSCYLNETLATGLMPETVKEHKKQRSRWAMGTGQMLTGSNPLLVPGLTMPQRLDYLGAIYFFLLGLPRIICLTAPVSWLVFSISPIKAETFELINFFFSSYLVSVMSINMTSRNTRNAFWSDVYETIVCFSMTKASFKGMFSGKKQRKFEVTAKGGVSKKRNKNGPAAIGWHLVLFGFLIFGFTTGFQEWLGPHTIPGLGISLWWAGFNLVLLTVAMIPARDQQQLRSLVRRPRNIQCVILDEPDNENAEILNMSESGMAIRIATPKYALEKRIRIGFLADEDEMLTIEGTIVRQEREKSGQATIGVEFQNLDDHATQALITSLFSTVDDLGNDSDSGMGVLPSLVSVLSVLKRLRETLQLSRRRTPRLPLARRCQLKFEGTTLTGKTEDVSFAGVSAVFPGRHMLGSQTCTLSISDVELTVSPVTTIERLGETFMRFRVETVNKGSAKWHALHEPAPR